MVPLRTWAIEGTVYCLGADCTVDAAGNLEGSWYFTPTLTTAFYLKDADAETYSMETLYAQYGHWLTLVASGDDEGAAMVNTYALSDGNTATLDYGAGAEGEPTSATYNGKAAGMSLHKTVDEDGEIASIYSGAFTADVSLLLRFSDTVADVTLGGTIDGFSGNAVDEGWSVELERKTLGGDGNFGADDGRTVTSGRDGEWTAQAYGTENERPTGIFGGFNAHFTDGHAAGAYATRKQ